MICATLNKAMEEMLKNIKESEFISYECGKVYNNAYGNLRINTTAGSIEITNLVKTTSFFDIEENVAYLECKISNPNDEFKPYCLEPFETFEVSGTIKSIEIINDTINVNDGEYEISFDRAIIFRTEKKDIMFSRDIWFSEVITINENDDYDAVYSIDEVVEAWSDEGKNKVNVIRTSRKL